LINAKIVNSAPGSDDIWPIDDPSQTKPKTFTQLEITSASWRINQQIFAYINERENELVINQIATIN